jgi:hypothetical protein
MIKAKKGLLIALFAAMMVFAFGAGSAFAATDSHTYTSVDWATDFHSATVTVKDVEYDQETEKDVTRTTVLDFEYFDVTLEDGMPATKADYTQFMKDHEYGYFVYPEWDSYSDGVVTYGLAACEPVKDGSEYFWEFAAWMSDGNNLDRYIAIYDSSDEEYYPVEVQTYGPAKKALEGELTKNVYDAYYVAGATEDWYAPIWAYAGVYSAWYATRNDKKPAEKNPVKVIEFAGFTPDDEDAPYVSVEYPEYNAYEFDTNEKGKKIDKTLTRIVSFNADAIKADFGAGVNVSTATGSLDFTPYITDVTDTDYYTNWSIKGANDVDTTEEDYRGWFVYDGETHDFALAAEPKAVTYKYYIDKADADRDFPHDGKAIKDDEWSDSFAGIKDAGFYKVYVQFTTTKNNVSVVESGTVYVAKRDVAIGFKQLELKTEYGKYTRESLEAAVKELIVTATIPDSTESLAAAVSKYVTVDGLFTDAGSNYLYTVIDEKAFAADKELSAALANYDLLDSKYGYGENGSWDANVDVPKNILPTMKLEIEKITNTVDFEAVSKTYKAKALKKKAKSFQLNATATYGEVKYAKVSGSAKIKVSKTGKVTVKKGTKKGTYKVKVKAYVNGTANYSAASQTVKMVIKVKK